MELYLSGKESDDILSITPSNLSQDKSTYGELIREHGMTPEERLILMLSLLPHIVPQVLDVFFMKNSQTDRGYTEFGGVSGLAHGGFLPTGETAMFLVAGDDLCQRFTLSGIFNKDHFFYKANILKLVDVKPDEPFLCGKLKISEEFIERLTTGKHYKPGYTTDFAAKKITTNYEWKDLVLEDQVLTRVNEIIDWIDYGDTLMRDWGLGKKIARGYRALFYGPSGTGKTLTASLIGKRTGRDVYRSLTLS